MRRSLTMLTLTLAGLLAGCTKATEPEPEDPGEMAELVLVGGAGDQSAYATALDGPTLYVSGPGILIRFDLSSASPAWISTAVGQRYEGVAAAGGSVFVAGRATAGRSATPGACGATDDVGSIEEKSLAGVYNAAGSLGRCESQVLYPYSGFEFYHAAATAGGEFFAGGRAQQGGSANAFPFVLARYDADAMFQAATTEPDLVFGSTTGCCTGVSEVWALGTIGSDLLAAGASRLPGSGEDDVLRPMVMRYTTALDRVWKGRSTDREGRFLDADEVGGAVYAVGESTASGTIPLVEKYSASGVRQWSVEPLSRQGSFTGVAGIGSRVFVVGTIPDGDLGGSDAVVLELDPSDGSTLDTIWVGAGGTTRPSESLG